MMAMSEILARITSSLRQRNTAFDFGPTQTGFQVVSRVPQVANLQFDTRPSEDPSKLATVNPIDGTQIIGMEPSIYKAVIPKFLYKPPFGYPRMVDIPEIRRLAATPFVDMCISTIINEIAAIKWEIVSKDDMEAKDENIESVREFFDNPNVNKESFETLLRRIIRDILEIDSGVLVKVFSPLGYMREMFARDGGTFTMSPDIFGTFAGKIGIIPTFYGRHLNNPKFYSPSGEPKNEIWDGKARVKAMQSEGVWKDYDLNQIAYSASYFQYGWITGARPMPFGKREIVYMMQTPRTDDIYGRSPVEICLDTIQMLVYGIDHNLEYYTSNNIPKGVLSMEGANDEDIRAFAQKWKESLRTKNEVGDYRKLWHKMPTINQKAEFKRIQFSSAELELITQSQWFSKVLWACFGVTPSELGFTESTNRATEIIQSRVFRRKAIRPLLTILEYHINKEIIPEFENGVYINAGEEDEKLIKGITDVKFMFNQFDLNEEIQKNELYMRQIKNKIRTPNEIREEEGLDPIEGGDEFPKFDPFGQGKFGQEGQDENEEPDEKVEKEQKALDTTPPLRLREFEEIAEPEKLIKFFNRVLTDQKRKILTMINVHRGKKTIAQVKDINKEVIREMKNVLNANQADKATREAVEEAYFKALDKIEMELGQNFIPDKAKINFSLEHALENVRDMTEEMKAKLRKELEMGLMAGESIVKMKKRIEKVFEIASNRAEMIARSETNRAANIGLQDAYSQSGIKGKKEWVAKLDDRTSVACRYLNGKTKNLNENFKYNTWEGPHPPQHPSCRSRLVFVPEE